MKKILLILLMLFTFSISAKEERIVVFDVTDVVQKGIGCEVSEGTLFEIYVMYEGECKIK
jgi:hypothetical protein